MRGTSCRDRARGGTSLDADAEQVKSPPVNRAQVGRRNQQRKHRRARGPVTLQSENHSARSVFSHQLPSDTSRTGLPCARFGLLVLISTLSGTHLHLECRASVGEVSSTTSPLDAPRRTSSVDGLTQIDLDDRRVSRVLMVFPSPPSLSTSRKSSTGRQPPRLVDDLVVEVQASRGPRLLHAHLHAQTRHVLVPLRQDS